MNDWSPTSWQSRIAAHQPEYPSRAAVDAVLDELARRPPLVTANEVDVLRARIADAAEGRRFLLQGGDCAESFTDCNRDAIGSKLKILRQMSAVLVQGLQRPVIRVGRLAGQYAKPRTLPMETREGVTLPSYRGDLVNRPEFSLEARTPDPARMLEGHACSAQTLNFIRATNGEFFTSHEALHLLYEQTQVQFDPRRERRYLTSTHFPWIGMRTGNPDGAHVEFCRGLANPLGIKVGPETSIDDLRRLVERLDPAREAGRLTLIHRFGHERIEDMLPGYIRALEGTGRRVLWSCDPMHGNTEATDSGVKTRRIEHILGELHSAFRIHAELGVPLGGVHFELTGDDVTECIGGARGLVEADLERAYKSRVDPRLNYEQALEMAVAIAGRDRAA